MAFSPDKRIAAGVCFGRKSSSIKQRDSGHCDKTFKSCNRLGCSVKHMILNVSSDTKLHSSQKTIPCSGLQKPKEQKRVTSARKNVNRQGSVTDKQKKNSESVAASKSSLEKHSICTGFVDGSPDSSYGRSSGNYSREPKKQFSHHNKCGDQNNSGPSIVKSGTYCITSPKAYGKRCSPISITSPKANGKRCNPRSLLLVSSSSPASKTGENISTPKNRGPPFGISSPRFGIISSALVKKKIIPSRSISRSCMTQQTFHNREHSSTFGKLGCQMQLANCGHQSQNQGTGLGDGYQIRCTGKEDGAQQSSDDVLPYRASQLQGSNEPCGPDQPHQHVPIYTSNLTYNQCSHDQHRDMRLNIDNMTYEELLALGERIGTVRTALTEEELSVCIKRSIYRQPCEIYKTNHSRDGDVDDSCCICQDEYVAGDEVGELSCIHRYHIHCIQQWFELKNWCPICRLCASRSN